MCGIAGLFCASGAPDAGLLRRMAGSILHRGPDDEGIWIDEDAGIGFGHRRLAIVDLSPQGHQPMASHDGRYVLSYNGEIYNHAELRASSSCGQAPIAAGAAIRDTETLVEASPLGGSKATLQKCVGMFALGAVGPAASACSSWPATGSAKSRSITAGSAAISSSRPS